jgi:hypothetical protein
VPAQRRVLRDRPRLKIIDLKISDAVIRGIDEKDSAEAHIPHARDQASFDVFRREVTGYHRGQAGIIAVVY